MTLRFSGFGIRANAGLPDEPLGIGAGAGWAGFGRARQGWANATAAVASRWVRSVWGSFGDSITKPPSAELAPGQMDTDSPPPYEMLDALLDDYVEKDMGRPS